MEETNSANETTGKNKNILQGLFYGIIPHIGCIAFIIGSILGVTLLTQLFRPLLMNPYFFHILILLSLSFATLSSILYLRKNGLLSSVGAKRKWKYLSTMYGSTIGVNLLLFLLIFPLLANVSSVSAASPSVTGNVVGLTTNDNSLSTIKLQVDIPCSGHAPLISGDLKTLSGVTNVQFSLPNIFDVSYDSAKTTKQQILAIEIFKTYPAKVLSESGSTPTSISSSTSTISTSTSLSQQSLSGSNGGDCCGGSGSGCSISGGSGCGGSADGCGCKH